MYYQQMKLSIISNIRLRMLIYDLDIENAINMLMDVLLSNEMFDFLVILLDIEHELKKLKQNLLTNYFNECNKPFYIL